ncbi:MAG: ATP-dependent RNA helicase [Tremellales sp. Tagirdzhanova-0007]|nr:MAG: ATP-dependent RNA helicase [Tremellales sp. Tagirdzhanova-0007]
MASAATSSSARLKAKSNKRKRPAPSTSSPIEIAKAIPVRGRLSGEDLPWQPVKASSFPGMDEGGGMMMLEELDNVDVAWDEDELGRKVARFVGNTARTAGAKGKKKKKTTPKGSESQNGTKAIELGDAEELSDVDNLPSFSKLDEVDLEAAENEPFHASDQPFDEKMLPAWTAIPLHPALKRALLALGFAKPTSIQERSLGPTLASKDVVGVAETGSGKTLAYALPILSHILRAPPSSVDIRRPLSALILCPTRELALQVVEHVNLVLSYALDAKTGPPRISVASVVGGLNAQKQKRILERGCDVLVATPGRLWDLIQTNDELAVGVRGLRFLVIDEADRMIENGHFAELENIVRLSERDVGQTQGPDDDDPVFAAAASLLTHSPSRDDMQTFVFSATLSKDLQQSLKLRRRTVPKKGVTKNASTLEDLVEKLDFRDPNPEVIDLSPDGGVVAQLKESIIECVVGDKDLYLYYFLLRYPGRSLVFVGSIDGIRRLMPLFEILKLPVYPLHSQLQQKQRLKNLDRFKSSPNGVLIATDVASRGLDIPNVDHVVHFNLPRTADSYIHRSGRTARAQNPGFALQLCAPEEKGMQRALMRSLNRTQELSDLPIESGFLPKLRDRIRLAKDIEKAQHQVKKANHDRNWLREAAEAMDVDIDPAMMSGAESDFDGPVQRRKLGRADKVDSLKMELREKLLEPLMARGVSARYPTSGSKVIIDDLIRSTGHPTMLGASTVKAYDQVRGKSKASLAKRKPPLSRRVMIST